MKLQFSHEDKDEFEGLIPSNDLFPTSTSTMRAANGEICKQKRIMTMLIGQLVAISCLVYLMHSSAQINTKMNSNAEMQHIDINQNEFLKTWNNIWDAANLPVGLHERAPSASVNASTSVPPTYTRVEGQKSNNQHNDSYGDSEGRNTTNHLDNDEHKSSSFQSSLHAILRVQQDKDENELRKIDAQQLFDIFPSPISTDTIKIYNKEAYHDLVKAFIRLPQERKQKRKRKLKICANGGSSTAGGGEIPLSNRYFTRFADFCDELNLTQSQHQKKERRNINVANRGHGSRHSLHSAVFAPNFLPPKTDLLLWEFAINDYAYGDHIPKGEHNQQERSMMIAWLEEVQKMKPKPPKVILIYLWKAPFEQTLKINGNFWKVNNPVFEAHVLGAELAERFDFVVGCVNLASYFDELMTITPLSPPKVLAETEHQMALQDIKDLFLADLHHPSSLGHLTVSFLLLNLLRGKGEWASSSSSRMSMPIGSTRIRSVKGVGSTAIAKEEYAWFCGNETEDKRFIRDRVVGERDADATSSSGWRSPIATMTLEQPQNLLVPNSTQLVLGSKASNGVTLLGKQDPLRKDRQGAISLPCCSLIPKQKFTDVRVSKAADSTPMQNVRGLFLGFAPGMSNIDNMNVYIVESDDKRTPVSGRLIRVPHDWPCFWTWNAIYDSFWFAFSEEEDQQRDISSLSMCVENSQCDSSVPDSSAGADADASDTDNNGTLYSGAMLISMAVYS